MKDENKLILSVDIPKEQEKFLLLLLLIVNWGYFSINV